MRRLLLLLPTATYRAPDFLSAAEALGAEVVIGTEERLVMPEMVGGRSLRVPLADSEAAVGAVAAFHRRSPIDAVVAVDDQGVLAAAAIARALGFPHNPVEAVAATRDKLRLRQRLSGAGIDQPTFRACWPGSDVGALARQVGLPCVVKPLSLSASRGVIRANDPGEATVAADRVRAILREAGEDANAPLLIDAYIAGAEVAVEGILEDGSLTVLAIFDKPDPLEGPFFEETLYVTPSRLPGEVQTALTETVRRAVAALGLCEGPVHAELRVRSDGPPVLLEVAARSIGGLCARALRFGAGISLEELILRHALRLGIKGVHRELGASGVMMLPVERSGRLVRVDGQDEARATPGIVGLELSINPGRPVVSLPEGDRYLGFLFARGATPGEVEHALREAHARLHVIVD